MRKHIAMLTPFVLAFVLFRWRTREMAVSGSEAANDIPVQAWRIAA